MTRDLNKNNEGRACRVVAHRQQLRIDRLLRIGNIRVVSVHRIQIGNVVHFVKMLPITRLLVLRLRSGLCGWHELLHPCDQRSMIRRHFCEHMEAKAIHRIKTNAFARRERTQKFENLCARIAQVVPGDVAFINHQDRRPGFRSRGRGRCSGEIRSAVREACVLWLGRVLSRG